MTESSEYIVQQVITNSTYSIESRVHLAGDHNCRQNQLSGNPEAYSPWRAKQFNQINSSTNFL